MPRPKGLPKTGGRKPGIRNKLSESARALMQEFGFDPLKGMMAIAADPKNDVGLRGRMYAELAQYAYPKLRAVEHSGPGGAAILHAIDPYEALERELARLHERERADEVPAPAAGGHG